MRPKLKQVPDFQQWLPQITPQYTWDWQYQVYIQSYLDRVNAGELKKLMLWVPPRHGKSEMVTIRYPVWQLLRDPEMRVIVGAYNQTLSERFSRKSRGIARNAGVELSEERATAADWETTVGGGVRAVGVGSGITGHGGNGIIVDDPVKSREEAESLAYRDRVYNWYTDDLYTRLEPGGWIIIIQTRWHEDDLSGRILASEDGPNWTVISLPAEAEENDPLGRELGEPLCPARYDKEALEDRRRVLGSYGYNALFQQRPAPPEGHIIKRAWIRYYTLPPNNFDRLIQSWDMAFKDGDSNSYVVGQVWGQVGGNFYLVHQVRDHMDFPTTLSAVRTMSAAYPGAVAKLVEEKANGAAVIQSLKNEISGLIPVGPRGSKEARLSAVAPLFEAGNIYVPQRMPWTEGYIGELCAFPNASNDDQADATSQALDYLVGDTSKLRPAIILPSDIDTGSGDADNDDMWDDYGSQ